MYTAGSNLAFVCISACCLRHVQQRLASMQVHASRYQDVKLGSCKDHSAAGCAGMLLLLWM